MADVEITRRTRLTRKQAGERLIALGKALSGGSTAEVEFDGDSLRFTVADHVEWELELEVDGDEVELEIELKWSDAPTRPVAPAEPATPAEAAAATEPGATADRATPTPRRRTKTSRGQARS